MVVKVLIVDDSKMQRHLLINLLPKEYDFEIDEAVDGIEAINKFSRNQYQLMFLDIHMPKVDGFEVLETISASTQDCRVVATSADIQDGAQKRAFDYGISSFVKKPFDFEDISRAVSTALNQ